MTEYFLVGILLIGILFLLYCLWSFARDLKPHRSSSVVSTSSNRARSHAIQISTIRTQPKIVHLQEHSRSAT
jgi:hypothetical protein